MERFRESDERSFLSLLVNTLSMRREPPQAAFGLSEAEARLAARLASGEPLETITEQFGIAMETDRRQLKGICAKNGHASASRSRGAACTAIGTDQIEIRHTQ